MDVERYKSLLEKASSLENTEELENIEAEIQVFLEDSIKKDKNDWLAESELASVYLRKIGSPTDNLDVKIEYGVHLNRALEHIKRAFEIQRSVYGNDVDLAEISELLANSVVDTLVRFVNRRTQELNKLFVECGSNPADSTYFSASMDAENSKSECTNCLYSLGDELEASSAETQKSAAVLWKCANDMNEHSNYPDKRNLYVYSKKINKYDTSYRIIDVEDHYKPLGEKIEIVKKIAEKGGELPDFFFQNEELTSYEIPVGITNIGKESFSGCKKLERITIPEGVKEIKFRAFKDCESLSTVTIPASVEKIDSDAFNIYSDIYGKTGLRELIFAKKSKLTTIGQSAFAHCALLKNVSLPLSLKNIGEWAFHGTGITEVTIPHFALYRKNPFPKDCKITYQKLIPWIIEKIKSLIQK